VERQHHEHDAEKTVLARPFRGPGLGRYVGSHRHCAGTAGRTAEPGLDRTRTSAARQRFFRDADIYRVRKLERICCDFELPVLGGTIIVDLLERIDTLERSVRSLQKFEE
jgi:hypothetical protein